MRRPISRKWILCIVATLSLAAGRLYADAGPIGTPFDTYHKSSELFDFFHFVETKRENAPHGGKIISFQPSGADFHSLVKLQVTTDDHDIVRLLQLSMKRSFIDNPKTVIFAADLAKSYLGELPSDSVKDPVSALAREITARAETGSSVTILSGQATPPPPEPPTKSYEVYAGKDKTTTITNEAGTLHVALQNESVDGVPMIELTVTAP